MKKRGKSKPKSHKVLPLRQHGSVGATARKLTPAMTRLPGNQSKMTQARTLAVAPAYEADERYALGLLLLPFLIMAMALGLSQTLRPMTTSLLEIARTQQPTTTPLRPAGSIALAPLALPDTAPAALRAPERIVLSTPIVLPRQAPFIAPAAPQVAALIVPTPPISIPLVPPAIAVAVVVPAPPIVVPHEPPTQLAALIVPTPRIALPLNAPSVPLPAATVPAPETFACLPAPKRAALSTPPSPVTFGAKLAEAAQAQTNDLVIYSATYKRIAYPMGDVPSLYGACSDLVIRAYRALGVDLQDLVQRARVGRGDPNIDHRRTDTLRAFFAKYGEQIPPSTFGEDYKPGDIVTYYRPFSRVSRAHIAIVSDIIGPSGRPMIVHNRGWGPQIEDALFVDKITGHYRFTGAPQLLIPSGRMVGDTHEPKASSRLPLPSSASNRSVARVGQLH